MIRQNQIASRPLQFGQHALMPASFTIFRLLPPGVTSDEVDDYRRIDIRKLVVNECFTDHCQNGATCESLAVSYVCHCEAGWAGESNPSEEVSMKRS